ncbi:MAG TPA: hypothetical protein DEZ27_12140 [Sphaerochaeta sp.]|nr:hypothetical protein [Sphaerochaeta sp.]
MYSDMGRPKNELFLVLVLLALCMVRATCKPTLDLRVSESGRKITVSDSGQFETAHRTSIPWSYQGSANLEDMGNQSDFLADFRFAIHFPRFGCIKTSFGDLLGDARISALLEGGFRLDMDRKLTSRELVVRPVAINGKTGGYIAVGTDPQLPISAHLFLGAPLSGTDGVGIAGSLFEYPLRAGIVRTAFAVVRSRLEIRDSWIVPYHHEPIGTGWVGYWSWVGTCELPRLPGFLQAGLLHRVAYDTLLGLGSSTIVQLEWEQGPWVCNFKRLDIDAFAGPVGSVSTSSVDSPHQELTFETRFEGSRIRFDVAMYDKRWRPTVFAGASQRRTVSVSTGIGYHADTWDGKITVDSTYRWNRSGTTSRIHTFAVKVNCQVRGVRISCGPAVSMGKTMGLNGTYALEKAIQDIGTVRVEFIHTAWKTEVVVCANARLPVGELEFSLGSSGGVSVTYSIVPKG